MGGIEDAIKDVVHGAALGDHFQNFGADLFAKLHLFSRGDVAGGGVGFDEGFGARMEDAAASGFEPDEFAVGAAEAELDLPGFVDLPGGAVTGVDGGAVVRIDIFAEV